MLFGMIERGMGIDFVGDKGKAKGVSGSTLGPTAQDAMWAVVLTKELWQKSIWFVLPVLSHFTLTFKRNDAKSVAIMAMACFYPAVKVQSASIHFFLGSDQENDEMEPSDDEVPLLLHLQITSFNASAVGTRSQDITAPSRSKQENSLRRQEAGKTNKTKEKGSFIGTPVHTR